MIDYGKEVVSALSAILPIYYEMALTQGLSTPCYSWQEVNNYEITETLGATVAYSRITFQVKVWGNDLADLNAYALKADAALKPLGFKRTSSGELYDNNSTMIQRIMRYEVLAVENY